MAVGGAQLHGVDEQTQALHLPVPDDLHLIHDSAPFLLYVSAAAAAVQAISFHPQLAHTVFFRHAQHGIGLLLRGGAGDDKQLFRAQRIQQRQKEAKAHESAPLIGMYLTHNGTVRQSAKAKVRFGAEDTKPVTGMLFSYDESKVNAVIEDAYKLEGIYYIKVWLNEGELKMGDDIMYVLIGGDIRPRVVDCLHYLVGRIKNECVVETELN